MPKNLIQAVQMYSSLWELKKSASYVVGVSGGRDSVALLYALIRCGFSNLFVCHLNHGLRGGQSDGDEDFVRQLSARLGLQFYSKTVDLSQSSLGVESAARDARYLFYAEIVRQTKSLGVFLGHHSDDQAETILFNLLRGSAGLKSIPANGFRDVQGTKFRLYRPLLGVSRSLVDKSIEINKLDYREDSTNAEGITARNRIRHELLPLAKEILKRDVSPMLLRSAEAIKLDNELISALFQYEDYLDPQGRLFVPKLEAVHRALQIRIVKRYLESQKVKQISTELLDRSVLLLTDSSVAKVNLPGGRHLRRKEKRLFVEE